MEKINILVFSPFSGIWDHFLTDVQIAELIQSDSRFKIEFLTCDGVFPNDCTVRDYLNLGSMGKNEGIDINCSTCTANTKTSHIEAKYKSYSLKKIQSEVIGLDSKVNKEKTNFGPHFIYDGVPLGKIAIYELLLKWKKTNLEFSNEQLVEICNYVENTFRTYLIAQHFFSMIKPDKILIFNPQYSVPGAFASAAIKNGIQTFYLSNSGTISEMRTHIKIWDWEHFKLKNPALENWKTSIGPISTESKRRLKKYFLQLHEASSPWVYSEKSEGRNSRQYFNIPLDNKIVLAVMNSTDEYFAAATCGLLPPNMSQSKVFENQEMWISELIEWVKIRKDVSLIIRPHPREFPNKREDVRGEAVDKRSELFENLPANVFVDYPSIKFAIEDHFVETSVVTTGWSSVGLDWQMRGKVCVTYDQNLPMYPPDTHLTGSTQGAYFRNLDYALNLPPSDTKIIQSIAEKWYEYSNFTGSAKLISSVFESNPHKWFLKYTLINSFSYRYFPEHRKRIEIKFKNIKSESHKIFTFLASNKKSFLDI